jgi:NADP-dependent 3-hydroxy acid dehydrogenase YdfG
MAETGVAIVTGATSGIGAATARRLAADQATVIAVGRRRERLDALVAETGPAVYPLALDVTRDDAAGRIIKTACAYGPIRTVVCNAGFGVKAPLVEGDVSDWREMFAVNVLAPMELAARAAPEMPVGSTIVLVSSIAGLRGLPGEAAYCATKAALNSIGESLRIELRGLGIRVVTLCPGTVRTEFELRSMDAEAAERLYAEQNPVEPEEVAELIGLLVALPTNVSVGRVDVRPRGQLV